MSDPMARPDARHPPIDGLRALAAIAVLLTHVAIYTGLTAAGGAPSRYAQRLEVGVAIFFVISGFVLYRPFVVGRTGSLTHYAERRAMRIVPAYWLALTVSALVLPISIGFTYYAFGQIYSQTTLTGGLVQAWTLCVEVTFYAFLPLWGRFFKSPWALLGLFAFSVAWKAAFVWSGPANQVVLSPWLHSLPAYLDQFALGMLLAWWSVHRSFPRWLPLVGVAIAALAFWVVSLHLGIGYRLFEPYTRWQFMGRHELYALIGASLVAAAAAASPGNRVFANRVALWLGTVSYGIYLWHVSVIQALQQWGVLGRIHWHPFVVGALLALVLTAGVAALSWYLLERPLLRSGGRPRARQPA